MVVLVPRQLRMTGMTGNVPYYGGRMSPAQAYAASHPAQPPHLRRSQRLAPPPTTTRKQHWPRSTPLLESGTISQAEHDELSSRITS